MVETYMVDKAGVTIIMESNRPRQEKKEQVLIGLCHTLRAVEEGDLWTLFIELMLKTSETLKKAI